MTTTSVPTPTAPDLSGRPARAGLRIIAGVGAAVWALAVHPPVSLEWAGPDGAPDWIIAMARWPVYEALIDGVDAIGWTDHYLVFGAAIVPAMLLAWWALHAPLRGFGAWGAVLSAMWLLLCPVTLLSYLNHPEDAPLHGLWGAEAFVLIGAFALALLVGIVGGRTRRVPLLARVLVASTVLFGVGGTMLTGYYPHGTMIGIGALAALVAWSSTRPVPELSPSGGRTSAQADR